MQQLYRYKDLAGPDGIRVYLETFYVAKETPCGYWYAENRVFTSETFKKHWRWVAKDANRSRCYDTLEAAWLSYRIRKEKQKWHMETGLKQVTRVLESIQDQETPPTPKHTGPGVLHCGYLDNVQWFE